jgi:hypothetical protein
MVARNGEIQMRDPEAMLEPHSDSISLVTGGVVLLGNTYEEDSARGRDVAIFIASLTQHYPLELSCLTHTHTHTASAC